MLSLRRGFVLLWILGVLGCRREPDAAERAAPPSPSPAASVTAARTPSAPPPPAFHGMPGALGLSAEQAEAPTEVAAVKSIGENGEWLEGDVFSFRLLSAKPCGAPAAAPGARAAPEPGATPSSTAALQTVVGAMVEIKAKSRLQISPRDVTLRRGGITFYASVDAERRLKGCSPLLKFATLRGNQVARGYVLFDLPPLDPNGLELGYRPTRWGGAGEVRVAVKAW